MSEPLNLPDALLHILRRTILSEIRADQPDLTLRQFAVALTIHLTDEPQTVRGLAEYLNISKPAVTRAFDRLGELDLIQRQMDPKDRRSVVAQRRPSGVAMLQRLRVTMMEAAENRAVMPL